MKRPNPEKTFQPSKGPTVPAIARRFEHTLKISEPPAMPPPRGKICLSIDVDESLGHIMRESYGDRLLVDKEQARRLAAVLLDYAGEQALFTPHLTATDALVKLSEQLKTLTSNDHCSKQMPPAEGAP